MTDPPDSEAEDGLNNPGVEPVGVVGRRFKPPATGPDDDVVVADDDVDDDVIDDTVVSDVVPDELCDDIDFDVITPEPAAFCTTLHSVAALFCVISLRIVFNGDLPLLSLVGVAMLADDSNKFLQRRRR